GGTYLFLAATPSDFAAFAAALAGWLPAFGPALPPRFLWIGNPNDPAYYWQAVGWFATATGPAGAAVWTTNGVGRFALDRYEVSVAPGAALTLSQSEPAEAVFAAGAACFRGPGGAFGPAGTSAIAFQGGGIGAWSGTLQVPADGLAALGVELRYAVRNALDPADPRLVPVSMPVLGAAAGAMTLAAAWDPLFPTTLGRTGLRFADGSPAIDARLVTQRGYATRLTPVATAAAPLWPGGLRFCRCASRIDAVSDPRTQLYSLAPDGAFSLAVVPPAGGAGAGLADQLMLGLSGLETAALGSSGSLLLFDSGHPAFAPNAAPDATVPGTGDTLLTGLATTAWLAVLPSGSAQPGLFYYAQPRQSPLFTGTGSAVMSFQPVPAARLPNWTAGGTPPAVYPVGVYSGIEPASSAAARALEQAALAPLRRQLITGRPPGLEQAEEEDVLAVTPQGVLVTLAADLASIDGVIVANLPTSGLSFGGIGPDFESALFANQSFFVASNAEKFGDQAHCVEPFRLDLDGWLFDLDPSCWRSGDAPTMMVWKYANRPLEALAADTASWAWQDAATDEAGDIRPTWLKLNAILEQAKRANEDDPASPYARFYRDVVRDPAWNGVLFLNAPVDPADLPDSLRFVAAGIDSERFYAHHVGASFTAFDPATVPITLKTTSVFGLIDYVDDVDLVAETTVPFQFKTLQLTARFANAHLADFACRVEISLNQLFAAQLLKQDPTHGNNLLMSGALQKTGGAPSYSFALVGANQYDALGTALYQIDVTSIRIETQANPAPGTVSTSFALGGRLRFWQAPDFDLFSYGPAPAPAEGEPPIDGWLAFSQLILTMDFPLADPILQSWTVNETGIRFDLANSEPRPDALAAGFPVTVSRLVASPNLAATGEAPSGLSPEDMGFVSIAAEGLDQLPMVPPWYGLVQTLDLGSLGALAGGVGLKAELLTAWMVSPSPDERPVYLGLRLPGTQTRSGSFPLQGVLKLGFKSFIFSTYEQDGRRAYLLKMSRFALSVLGFSFPPGNLDISLFGGPQGRSTGQLGWLAAYTDPEAKQARTGESAMPRSVRRKRLGRLSGS
ncbi:MAG TPA: hypothetical protein VEA60_10005, partial [Allosphingosinicella sp.]|nr:hypothetical protein [Allosphingosinicella sp.]